MEPQDRRAELLERAYRRGYALRVRRRRQFAGAVSLLVAVGIASAAIAFSSTRTDRTVAVGGTTTSQSTSSTTIPGHGLECPRTMPSTIPHHQRRGTTQVIVPGEPVALLGCHFHGSTQRQLEGSLGTVASLPASTIAAELNATPIPAPGAPAPFCPADFGERYLLLFAYRDGSTLVVSVDRGGCSYVDNGDLHRPFAPTALEQRLATALGQDPPLG